MCEMAGYLLYGKVEWMMCSESLSYFFVVLLESVAVKGRDYDIGVLVADIRDWLTFIYY